MFLNQLKRLIKLQGPQSKDQETPKDGADGASAHTGTGSLCHLLFLLIPHRLITLPLEGILIVTTASTTPSPFLTHRHRTKSSAGSGLGEIAGCLERRLSGEERLRCCRKEKLGEIETLVVDLG